jgi:hypothetical protein
MKKLLYLFLVLPLMFSSCKKEEGCTDSQATNYIADAEEDDGSCLYSLVSLWNLDDQIVDGNSFFNSSISSSYLISGYWKFYSDNTFLKFQLWNDSISTVETGLWSLNNNSLEISQVGGNSDFLIEEFNGNKLILNLDGVQNNITLKLSR